MLVMGLVLAQSLMAISTTGMLLYAKIHCCCLHINYIVYKHFDRSLHVGSLDPTCVQNLRPLPLMVLRYRDSN